ncbi:MAG: hypothetical protein M3Z64_12460 [Verrucomicrobiota bacterium]|nr:hypothetical protein [Verrucomicrobiota bacterium]
MSALLSSTRSSLRPLAAGLFVTLLQLFITLGLIAPEGPLSYRYDTLIQHDSYWFANIVDRGYATTIPPISHKMMEVSNVAFFPAYPAFAALLRYGLHLSTYAALLMTAQAAAFGFWAYFFLFCERWNLSPKLQFFGALAVFAHPTAFFLITGYSESLFMMALFGFLYWSGGEGRLAKFLAVVHGIVMSGTRIVGVPCAGAPVVTALAKNGWAGLRDVRSWFARYSRALLIMIAATLGAIGFFFFCLFRWGRWDMYMLTQNAGWGIVPDYLAVFKPESYRWHIPHLNDPTSASQMLMTLAAVLFVVVAICELIPAIRRTASWQNRIGFYFAAAVIYYISVSGVACVEMESMLRYEFCVHALFVLAFLQFLHQLPPPPVLVRRLGMATAVLLSAGGLALQGWYVWNFTRGGWVA